MCRLFSVLFLRSAVLRLGESLPNTRPSNWKLSNRLPLPLGLKRVGDPFLGIAGKPCYIHGASFRGLFF